MSENSPHQPHDKLFKSTFSEPTTAAAFLKTQLPPFLSSRLDWSTLKLESGSFIDERLLGSESDLLYRATLDNDEAFLYVLFEHQRKEDPWMLFRLLRYIVRVWEKYQKEHPEADGLLPVIPVVLAQNAKPWRGSTNFHDFVKVAEDLKADVLPRTPGFQYELVQLAELPFDKIVGTPSGILTLRALKAEQIKMLLDQVVWDESLLIHLPAEAFSRLLHYIFYAKEVDKEGFLNTIKHLNSSELRENTMTLAQQFRQEGRQEGRQEEAIRLIRRLLNRRFGDLPDWAEVRLGEATINELEEWGERVLDAKVLDEVFA